MKIEVNAQVSISEILDSDVDSYVTHMKDREIYEKTIGIPFPYGEVEAKWWINAVKNEASRFKIPLQYAIRNQLSELIGGIGFIDMKGPKDHAAELGFWLAKPYRNKGIITNCVRCFCDWAFNDSPLELVRIQCRVFAHNEAAIRVMEKCSFEPEGHMRKRFKKDDQYIDAKIFALIR